MEVLGSWKKQALILSLLSTIIVSRNIFDKVWDAATVFEWGAVRFWNFENPYLPHGDRFHFKYSPLFALFYSFYTFFPSWLHAGLWGVTNVVVYWIGISLWFPMSKFRQSNAAGWFLFFLVIASMEMDGPTRHLQMNPFLIGAMLVGLHLYKKEKYFEAGVLLIAIGTFKIFMIMLPVMLLFNGKRRYWLGFAVGAALAFLLPIARVGWARNLAVHQEWLEMLLDNSQVIVDKPLEFIISLANTFFHLGYPWFGKILSAVILVSSSALLAWQGIRQRRLDLNIWVPLCLTCIILVNPGTEGPTFVILIPSFLFLMAALFEEGNYPVGRLAFLTGCAVLITLCHNDIWPKSLINISGPRAISKVFGSLLLWIYSAYICIKSRASRY